MSKVPKLETAHLELDVKSGRRWLEKEIAKGRKVKVIIEAELEDVGTDDGISTVFLSYNHKVKIV